MSMINMNRGGMQNMNNIPQTDNTRTIEVNVYDAKLFLGRIESQVDFFEQIVDRPNEAKHWKTLLESAKELLNVNQES